MGATIYAGPETVNLPSRQATAKGAKTLIKEIGETTGTRLQEILVSEILSGNVPDRSRTLVPVKWKVALPNSQGALQETEVTINAIADYLSVGSNEDYLRVALTPDKAQFLADRTQCHLPTTEMVNRIYQSATLKLPPRPINPREHSISHVSIWMMNNELVNEQLQFQRSHDTSQLLLAGIKKDVVITNRLKEPAKSPRVAIYGWHKLDGKPIQPLTLVHVWWYVDYSHGIRLVSNEMLIGEQRVTIKDVLKDPKLAFILSNEGPMEKLGARYPEAAKQ